MVWGPDRLEEGSIATPAEAEALRGRGNVLWLNVDGLGDADLIAELGERFGHHRLALEDVLNVPQRPKLDVYADHFFVTLRAPRGLGTLETEQVALFVGEGVVLTIQEREGDCLDPVRERIRNGRPRLRKGGPDYLAYALLDVIVDSYYPLVESCGERLQGLEDAVLADPSASHASEIHELRRDLGDLQRAIWPLREIHHGLSRGEDPLVTDETLLFLRDWADHVQHVGELIGAYLEAASNLMELHLSLMSQRMNEVMKVLTIIATIFIPLSFVAGLYGMNFDPDASAWNLPELRWRWGYPYALGLMATVAAVMLAFFRRRGWFR